MNLSSLPEAVAAIRSRNKRHYTYIICRTDGSPFYVGFGKNWRVRQHEYDAKAGKRGYRYSIIRKIKADGGEVLYSIAFFDDRQSAMENERRLIALYGRIDTGTGVLTNRTDGGDSGPMLLGSTHSPQARAKISKGLTGIKRTAKQTELRKQACALRWQNPEYRAKMLESYARAGAKRRGEKQTEEHRLKVSAALTGRKLSQEHREKILATKLQRKLSATADHHRA